MNILKLFIVRATFFLYLREETNVNNAVKLNTFLKVRYDPEQTTLRSTLTILHPITEIKGRKSC